MLCSMKKLVVATPEDPDAVPQQPARCKFPTVRRRRDGAIDECRAYSRNEFQ
jgi:hypothetical protein